MLIIIGWWRLAMFVYATLAGINWCGKQTTCWRQRTIYIWNNQRTAAKPFCFAPTDATVYEHNIGACWFSATEIRMYYMYTYSHSNFKAELWYTPTGRLHLNPLTYCGPYPIIHVYLVAFWLLDNFIMIEIRSSERRKYTKCDDEIGA